MNEINQNERIASERLSSLESPARRLLIKGMAGLGATLVSSRSLRLSLLRLRVISRGFLQSGTSRPGWVGTFYSIEW